MRILELEWRNFNSYGNALTKLDLRDPNFYLLYGQSGVGKSTIREIIGWLLYGKVEGKTKGSLPNRINKKDCFGRILIETSGSIIEIKRGIKPDIFEVVIDGEAEDTAGKKNVQEILEIEYYKIPQSTYNNVITISIDKFKSFLKMSPGDKRKIIDQIFSFVVFNKVYEKLNRKVLDYNTDLKNVNGKITVLVDSKNDITDKIKNINSTNKKQILEKLNDLAPKIKELQVESGKFTDTISTIKSKQDQINIKSREVRSDFVSILNEIETVDEKIDLYSNDKCPECTADFKSDYHQVRKDELNTKKDELSNLKTEKELKLTKLGEMSDKVSAKLNQLNLIVNETKSKLIALAQEYKMTKANADKDTKELDGILENTISKLDELNVDLDNLSENGHLYSEISKIFAEDGVKKQILNSILPELNKNINDFAKKLHFPYLIELDNTFKSVITSLGQEIPVSTLSTGEHKKADFSVLISIIKIMKRNFPGINMLFLDELLGNIDPHGTRELLYLTRTVVDDLEMNVIVINHTELPSEIFDYKIEVTKNLSFSEMLIEKT